MTRQGLLTQRERLLAILPAAALVTAPAVFAQTDIQTTVVRLGVPSPVRQVAASRTQVSHEALLGLQRERHSTSIRRAAAAMDWNQVLANTRDMSNVCKSKLDVWARGNALEALGQQQELSNFYAQVMLDCEDGSVLTEALKHAAYQLDATGRYQVHAAAIGRNLAGEALVARDSLLRAAIDARITDHIERQEWSDAIRIAAETSDRDRLVEVGWAVLELDSELGRDAFRQALRASAADVDEESRYGFALTSFRLGDLSPALAYHPAPDAAPASYAARGAELAALSLLKEGEQRREDGDWKGALDQAELLKSYGRKHLISADSLEARTYLSASQTAYDAKMYDEARQLARAAAKYPETARAGAMRVAWSDLQLGKNEDAARAFRRLYAESQDSESANGLVLASANMDTVDSLGPFARLAGGPLGGVISEHQSDEAFARDDFLTAYELSPQRHPELNAINEPWVRQSVAGRSTRGRDGEGKVEGIVTRTSLGFVAGRAQMEVGVAGVSFSSGQAPDSAAVGVPGQPNANLDVKAASPFMRLMHEGRNRISAMLSTTPIGGAVSAHPTGSIDIERRSRRTSLRGRIHTSPVDETITSLTGREDPVTGEVWGRAVKSGVEVAARYNLRTDIVVSGGASAAVVSGKHLKDNSTFSIDAGISKSFDIKGLEYLSAGPFYQFQSYDKNTNFHTVGHGGYFSPQSFHRAGVGVNLQTQEKRNWIARLDAAAAYEDVETDAAPVLPRTAPLGPQFFASHSSGLALSTKIEIGRRIDDNWIISAGVNTISSEAYDDTRGGLSLRYTFGKRKSVVSRDLQPDIANRDIW